MMELFPSFAIHSDALHTKTNIYHGKWQSFTREIILEEIIARKVGLSSSEFHGKY